MLGRANSEDLKMHGGCFERRSKVTSHF